MYATMRLIEYGSANIFSLIVVAIGFVILVLGIRGLTQIPIAKELDSDGVHTQGIIIDRWTRSDQDHSSAYYVAYEYADGLQAKEKVPSMLYRQLQKGDSVSVLYLKRDPKLYRLDQAAFRKRLGLSHDR